MMISEDPWQLIGTVQCLVSIASPTAADQLREVKSASIHILARGRLMMLLLGLKIIVILFSGVGYYTVTRLRGEGGSNLIIVDESTPGGGWGEAPPVP